LTSLDSLVNNVRVLECVFAEHGAFKRRVMVENTSRHDARVLELEWERDSESRKTNLGC
jgi:hypothetical protein